MSVGRVLIVDDDPPIRTLVAEFLTRSGYRVDEAADGLAGLQAFYRTSPGLVILDVAMPELDGWQVLQRIREVSDIPVLMLTAKTEETDKVRGLRGGADDYLTKPFGRQELLARVDALFRRAKRDGKAQEVYSDVLLTVDFRQRRAELRGRELALTPLEFRLLAAFVRHPKQVLSHNQLLELAWGDARWVSREQLRLTVSYLRRKLGADGRQAIETVRGFGYRYRPTG
jgi:DNA-binding response OmpR family regulator